MPAKRFQPEEVIGTLRHADVLLGRGTKVAASPTSQAGAPDLGVRVGLWPRIRRRPRPLNLRSLADHARPASLTARQEFRGLIK